MDTLRQTTPLAVILRRTVVSAVESESPPATCDREISILLPNNQRQHRTLHDQKDVLPYALR